MKNILAFAIAIVLLLCTSCSDEDRSSEVDQALLGEWELTEVTGNGSSVAILPGFSFPSDFTISTKEVEGTLTFESLQPRLQADAKAVLDIETFVGSDVVIVQEELTMDSKSEYTIVGNELLLDKRFSKLSVPTVIGTVESDFQNAVLERVATDSLYLYFLYDETIVADEGYAVAVIASIETIWIR